MMERSILCDRGPARLAAAAVTLTGTGAMVVAGVLLLAGCVSSGQFKTVEQERDALSTRNERLKAELAAAQETGAALGQERTSLASEKEAMAQRLSEIEAREQALGSRLQQTEEEARKLKGTYDGLVSSLKKELEAGQIQVQQMRDGLRVNVAQEILFDSGSAALDASGREVLQRVAAQLQQTPYQVLVTGHTDNKPIGGTLVARYPTNWELAGARAASVVRLFAESGLSTGRMLAVSMGETSPVASNDTLEGRARNRRIEIRLRPVPEE